MSHPSGHACALFSVEGWTSPRRAPVPQGLSLEGERKGGPRESGAQSRFREASHGAFGQTLLPRKVRFFSGHEESGSGEGAAQDCGTKGGAWCHAAVLVGLLLPVASALGAPPAAARGHGASCRVTPALAKLGR